MPRETDTIAEPAGFGAAAEPSAPSAQVEAFSGMAVRELARQKIQFLLAGSYAVSAYTGITRATKDLDLFCRPLGLPRRARIRWRAG
ncbi:MAG TPA: hypothetical protein VKX28_08275 [Xanthobacteraceae bacterium]|nr:hypothetical protein [Xanthobacteraceae bacterium]